MPAVKIPKAPPALMHLVEGARKPATLRRLATAWEAVIRARVRWGGRGKARARVHLVHSQEPKREVEEEEQRRESNRRFQRCDEEEECDNTPCAEVNAYRRVELRGRGVSGYEVISIASSISTTTRLQPIRQQRQQQSRGSRQNKPGRTRSQAYSPVTSNWGM
jgi:hypothetical protein